MNWEINYETEPETKPEPLPTFEVTETKISHLNDTNQSSIDTGKLYLVDPIELGEKYTYKYMPPHLLQMHTRMRERFGVGEIVSYSMIKEIFPELKQLVLSYRLTYLWANGYLEKYVKGKWGYHFRGNYEKKGGWTRGKYFGVHYRILDK